MPAARNTRNAFTILISILFACSLLLSIAHTVFFNRAWQAESIGGTGDTLMRSQYDATMNFLEGDAGAALPAAMTSAEQDHMHDVKRVVTQGKIIETIMWILFAASGTAYCFLQKKRRSVKNVLLMVKDASMTLFSIGALLIICALFFDAFFSAFHAVLFPQGNWMFPPDSLLIRMFPETLFLQGFIRIVGETVGTALLLLVFALLARHFAEEA